jgi:hypothetical protein
MQNDLGTVLPLFAIAIFLCGVSAAAVDAIDDPAKGTFPHCLGVRDFDAHQRTSIEMTAKREKYLSALGQSPEGFALMKTDPLRMGSKVSKIE